MTLYFPSDQDYIKQNHTVTYNNKDYLWRYLQFLAEFLKNHSPIVWEGESRYKDLIYEATKQLINRKSACSRADMGIFYCAFYGNGKNNIAILNHALTKSGYELGHRICKQGAISFNAIAEFLNWPKPKESRWSGYVDDETLKRWTNLKDSAPISLGCFSTRNPNNSLNNWGERSIETYVLPEPSLMQFYMEKELADEAKTTNDDLEQFIHFSGDDFLVNALSIQGLIMSKTVAPTSTKIGVNATKRLSQVISLKPFPTLNNISDSRINYVTALSILAFSTPENYKLPKEPYSEKVLLRNIFNQLQFPTLYILAEALKTYVKMPVKSILPTNLQQIGELFNSLTSALSEISAEWISYSHVYALTHLTYSKRKCLLIIPTDYQQYPEKIFFPNGAPMGTEFFKENIHDAIYRCIIEGMAAIGGLDLKYDNNGMIRYIRLTNLGKWYIGLTDELPQPSLNINLQDAIDVDYETGMILVKDHNYPYLRTLDNSAIKITDSRYYITAESLTSGCSTPSELNAKIESLKRFIIPEPCGKIEAIIKKAFDKCNKFTPSQGSSTYRLFDIDLKDSELQQLILTNSKIRENCLRVEGCRLLVKENFIPTLYRILASNGYLNDSII